AEPRGEPPRDAALALDAPYIVVADADDHAVAYRGMSQVAALRHDGNPDRVNDPRFCPIPRALAGRASERIFAAGAAMAQARRNFARSAMSGTAPSPGASVSDARPADTDSSGPQVAERNGLGL